MAYIFILQNESNFIGVFLVINVFEPNILKIIKDVLEIPSLPRDAIAFYQYPLRYPSMHCIAFEESILECKG